MKKRWANFWGLRAIFKGKMRVRTNAKLLQSATIPVITYGAQTWAVTGTQMERPRRIRRKMERHMVEIRWEERITNEEVRQRIGMEDIGKTLKKLKGLGKHIKNSPFSCSFSGQTIKVRKLKF